MRTPTFHAMRGDFCGKHYGTILGINAFPMGIGMMIAPVIVGYLYDTYDTYYYSFIVMAALCILSCILISIIKNPKIMKKSNQLNKLQMNWARKRIYRIIRKL